MTEEMLLSLIADVKEMNKQITEIRVEQGIQREIVARMDKILSAPNEKPWWSKLSVQNVMSILALIAGCYAIYHGQTPSFVASAVAQSAPAVTTPATPAP